MGGRVHFSPGHESKADRDFDVFLTLNVERLGLPTPVNSPYVHREEGFCVHIAGGFCAHMAEGFFVHIPEET